MRKSFKVLNDYINKYCPSGMNKDDFVYALLKQYRVLLSKRQVRGEA